jgi:hypothetical protein
MAGENSPLHNPEYWELCAAKARIIAHTLYDPEAKAMMATVIDTYEKMAQRAVALQKLLRPPKGNDTADATR